MFSTPETYVHVQDKNSEISEISFESVFLSSSLGGLGLEEPRDHFLAVLILVLTHSIDIPHLVSHL